MSNCVYRSVINLNNITVSVIIDRRIIILKLKFNKKLLFIKLNLILIFFINV